MTDDSAEEDAPSSPQPETEAAGGRYQPAQKPAGEVPFRWETVLAATPDRQDLVRLAGASLVAETSAHQVHETAAHQVQGPGDPAARNEPSVPEQRESPANLPEERTPGHPAGMVAAARRAAQAGRGRLADARSGPAYDQARQVGRGARDAAAPHLSRAGRGVRQKIEDNPELAEKIVRNVILGVMNATAKKLPHGSSGIEKAAPVVASKLAAKALKRLSPDAGQASQADAADAGGGGQADQLATDALSAAAAHPGDADIGELADVLGVQSLLDSEALYRDEPGRYELRFSLPQELAALPWDTMDRKTQFCVLFAAWARREADGLQQLTAGQASQARDIFTECLARAEQLQVAELLARSYEDLGRAATVADDSDGARAWHNAAVRARASAGHAESSSDPGQTTTRWW